MDKRAHKIFLAIESAFSGVPLSQSLWIENQAEEHLKSRIERLEQTVEIIQKQLLKIQAEHQ